jgi:hypothetical protein
LRFFPDMHRDSARVWFDQGAGTEAVGTQAISGSTIM